MRFYHLDTLGDPGDASLCFLEGTPQGSGAHYVRLARGYPAAEFVPQRLTMQLQEQNEGLGLPSLVGNTNSFLIVAAAMHAVIAEHLAESEAELETFPFTILDHKGRVHSDDYALLNPLGTHDVVHDEASDIEYFNGQRDKVVAIRRIVLDRRKLEDVPPLFRLDIRRTEYIIAEPLTEAFAERGFTNVVLHEIEQEDPA